MSTKESLNLDPTAVTVLIADSLTGLRNHAAKIVKALTERPTNILEATDGPSLVELATAYSPELVIMDVALPLLNGIKAAAEIWSLKPDTKILFWTQSHREVHMRDLGRIVPRQAVWGYVLKNQADDKLRYAITSVWFHSNPYIDPEVRLSLLATQQTPLSENEFETLQDLVLGLTEKAISMRRHISVRGVQCRTAAVYNKLLPGKRGSAAAGGTGATASGDPMLSDVFNPRARMFFEAVRRGLVEPDTLAVWERDLDIWLRTELGIERS